MIHSPNAVLKKYDPLRKEGTFEYAGIEVRVVEHRRGLTDVTDITGKLQYGRIAIDKIGDDSYGEIFLGSLQGLSSGKGYTHIGTFNQKVSLEEGYFVKPVRNRFNKSVKKRKMPPLDFLVEMLLKP